MPYKLAPCHGDTLAVPQTVLAHLAQADGDTVRAALPIYRPAPTRVPLPGRRALPSIEAAHLPNAILGGRRTAGICRRQGARRAGRRPSGPDRPGQPGRPVCGGPVRHERPWAALSRSELQRLVGLYLNEGWQPDVILLCCAECPPGTPERGRCVPRADPLAGGRRRRPAGTPNVTCAGSSSGRTGVLKPPR